MSRQKEEPDWLKYTGLDSPLFRLRNRNEVFTTNTFAHYAGRSLTDNDAVQMFT